MILYFREVYMKKKWKLAMVTVGLAAVLLISGCSKSNSQEKDSGKADSGNESKTEETDQKTVTNDFDEAANQKETFGDISYQVPQNWEKEEESDRIYYYPENGKLMVTKGDGQIDLSDDGVIAKFESNYSEVYNDYKQGDGSSIEVMNHSTDGYIWEYTGKPKELNIEANGKVLLFNYNNCVYMLVYADYTSSNYNHMDDFEKIIGSLTPAAQDEAAQDGASQEMVDGMRVEFKEAMDSYKSFFDEYIAFMEKYKSSSDQVSMMTDYMNYMSQYTETMEKLDALKADTLNEAELKYYTDTMLEIENKLLSVQ